MKLYSFAALAVLGAASADTSVLKFRNGGLVEEITWDGTSLIVPQLCRASECAALAATDVQQATTNGVLASHIAGASERAQVTAKGFFYLQHATATCSIRNPQESSKIKILYTYITL